MWFWPAPPIGDNTGLHNRRAHSDASLSTVGPSYNVRIAAGLRTFDAFYVGPEVQAFGAGDNYHQLRAGLHVTGFGPASSSGRPAPAGPPTPTSATAPTASSAC